MIEKASDYGLVKTLKEKFLLFDYVTQYVLQHENIAEPEAFRFTQFDEFVKFLEERGFKYDSESEKLLKQLEENVEKEKYVASVQNEIATIKTKIMSDKRTEILNHKDDIVKELERMIVERYTFQKGQIKITLRNDSEVVDAIKLLENPAKYKAILKKQ